MSGAKAPLRGNEKGESINEWDTIFPAAVRIADRHLTGVSSHYRPGSRASASIVATFIPTRPVPVP